MKLNRKYLAIGIAIIVLLFGSTRLFKADSYETRLKKQVDVVNYYLEGNMTVKNSQTSDTNNYKISVSYENKEEVDYYKVSLMDTVLNQEQIMLRNDQGIYVLTPTLNQVFEFKGDWPTNSAKPYLYHSLIGVMNGTYEIQKVEDGHIVRARAEYPNMEHLVTQEIKFDKDYKPVYLKAFTEGGTEPEMLIEFTLVEFDKEFAEDHFVLNDSMKKSRDEKPTEEVEEPTSNVSLPVYPLGASDTVLVSTTTQMLNGNIAYILEFSGRNSFTVVQTEVADSDSMVVTQVDGELVQVGGTVGYATNQYLTYFIGNKMYQIYSSSMTTSEKISVATSLNTATTVGGVGEFETGSDLGSKDDK